MTCELTVSHGALPRDLGGTFLWNGPGICEAGDDALSYFDAYGMICAATFADGKARFRNRHVRSDVFEAEQKAGRQLQRRAFTNLPSRWANLFKILLPSTGMHDAFFWNGKVYAGDDRGHYVLDSALKTIGKESWGGRVKAMELMCPIPRVVGGQLIAYKIKPGIAGPDTITFYEFDRDLQVKNEVSTKLTKSNAFLHDVTVTDNWFIVFESPMTLRIGRALFSKSNLYSAFEWPAGKTAVLTLVPRRGGGAPIRLAAPADHVIVFHMANAYEADGKVVIDASGEAGPVDFSCTIPEPVRARQGQQISNAPTACLRRYTVDPASHTMTTARIGECASEEPHINTALHGRPHRYVYSLSATGEARVPDPNMFPYIDAIAKIDTNTGAFERYRPSGVCAVGQPSFAARAGATDEDDGYVITMVLDIERERAKIVILDAKRFAAGPIAELPLDAYFTQPSHTRFEPEYR